MVVVVVDIGGRVAVWPCVIVRRRGRDRGGDYC